MVGAAVVLPARPRDVARRGPPDRVDPAPVLELVDTTPSVVPVPVPASVLPVAVAVSVSTPAVVPVLGPSEVELGVVSVLVGAAVVPLSETVPSPAVSPGGVTGGVTAPAVSPALVSGAVTVPAVAALVSTVAATFGSALGGSPAAGLVFPVIMKYAAPPAATSRRTRRMAIGALLPPAGGAAVRVAGAWVSEGACRPSDQLSSAPGAAMLPTYPFQRRRYWLAAGPAGQVEAHGLRAVAHPVLGAALEVAEGELRLWSGRLSRQAPAWLAEHRVFEQVVVPGTGWLDLALCVAEEVGASLDELVLHAPRIVPEGGAVRVQARVDGAARALTLHACDEGGAQWVLHASGRAAPTATLATKPGRLCSK